MGSKTNKTLTQQQFIAAFLISYFIFMLFFHFTILPFEDTERNDQECVSISLPRADIGSVCLDLANTDDGFERSVPVLLRLTSSSPILSSTE